MGTYLEYGGLRRARSWGWVHLNAADLIPSIGNRRSAGNEGLQMERCVKSIAGVVCRVYDGDPVVGQSMENAF